jgi:hypothetical protein
MLDLIRKVAKADRTAEQSLSVCVIYPLYSLFILGYPFGFTSKDLDMITLRIDNDEKHVHNNLITVFTSHNLFNVFGDL